MKFKSIDVLFFFQGSVRYAREVAPILECLEADAFVPQEWRDGSRKFVPYDRNDVLKFLSLPDEAERAAIQAAAEADAGTAANVQMIFGAETVLKRKGAPRYSLELHSGVGDNQELRLVFAAPSASQLPGIIALVESLAHLLKPDFCSLYPTWDVASEFENAGRYYKKMDFIDYGPPDVGAITWLNQRLVRRCEGSVAELVDLPCVPVGAWGTRLDLAPVDHWLDAEDMARRQREAMLGLKRSGVFADLNHDLYEYTPGRNWDESIFRS